MAINLDGLSMRDPREEARKVPACLGGPDPHQAKISDKSDLGLTKGSGCGLRPAQGSRSTPPTARRIARTIASNTGGSIRAQRAASKEVSINGRDFLAEGDALIFEPPGSAGQQHPRWTGPAA